MVCLKNFSYSNCESNVHVKKTVNSITVFESIYFDESNIIKIMRLVLYINIFEIRDYFHIQFPFY
jgi:hypothetical protein